MRAAKISIISVLIIFIASCTRKTTPKNVKSGVFTEFMDTSIKPGDNFYLYANGNWIKNTEIPSNRPDYWMGTVLYGKSMEKFQAIIQKSLSSKKEDNQLEFLLGSFYKSYTDTLTRLTVGSTVINEELDKIDDVDDVESLIRYFAHATKYSIITPFKYEVYEDLRTPKINSLYINQSGLTLPDKDYYFDNDVNSRTIRKEYQKHMISMFRLANIKCDTDCVLKIMDLEKTIASFQSCKEETRDY
jgi:putative endopeptidase